MMETPPRKKGLVTLGETMSPEMVRKMQQIRERLAVKTELETGCGTEASTTQLEQPTPAVIGAQDFKSASRNTLTFSGSSLERRSAHPKKVHQAETYDTKPFPNFLLKSSPALSVNPTSISRNSLFAALRVKEDSKQLFDLCIFNLGTLVDIADLQSFYDSGRTRDDEICRKELQKTFRLRNRRTSYNDRIVFSIKSQFPTLKMGVIASSSLSFAQTVLSEAFSSAWWDIIISKEDVTGISSSSERIDLAMRRLSIERPRAVLFVGSSLSDISAAYDAGATVALDKSSWPTLRQNYKSMHWDCLKLVPDAVLERSTELLPVLKSFPSYLPDMERRLERSDASEVLRFDKVKKTIPAYVDKGSKTYHDVYCCSRYFTTNGPYSKKKEDHKATSAILANKDSTTFPDEWISSISSFVATNNGISKGLAKGSELVVSVIPHRPGRPPRLERLIEGLMEYVRKHPFPYSDQVSFEPRLLAYSQGVRSNHNDKLGARDRFTNVRDHLYVQQPHLVVGWKDVLVIDDVCTTGASLFYANQYLKSAGSGDVTSLALAMTVGQNSI